MDFVGYSGISTLSDEIIENKWKKCRRLKRFNKNNSVWILLTKRNQHNLKQYKIVDLFFFHYQLLYFGCQLFTILFRNISFEKWCRLHVAGKNIWFLMLSKLQNVDDYKSLNLKNIGLKMWWETKLNSFGLIKDNNGLSCVKCNIEKILFL